MDAAYFEEDAMMTASSNLALSGSIPLKPKAMPPSSLPSSMVELACSTSLLTLPIKMLKTSSGTLIAENPVLPTTSDIRHVARGTNVDIKEKTQFKRAGSTFKPKPRVGLADKTTLLKSILDNGNMKTVEASSMIDKELNGAAETQVDLELTLGFNCQSNKGKKII
ncbi:LOB domain-containing protein [Trifolium repens]|nr:LOB domain-containing protein [Trifolium repens]